MVARVGSSVYEVSPDEEFVFGRSSSCTVCLDPADVAISRHAGALSCENGAWFVVNRSASRNLVVVDDSHLRSVLGPGKRHLLQGPTRVLVQGSEPKPHVIEIEAPEGEPAILRDSSTGLATVTGVGVALTFEEKLALVALFAGYLQKGELYDPYPRTYEAAAKRLGWPRSTLLKKIEYLRTRLTRAGVPGMSGNNALLNLAEHVLTLRLVVEDDLRLIGK
ncbi:FHA domain-containing protein [Saccharothrix variisporea]|uniref:FHA domain-containing protein n=1 Tax=Saccharothrix variisporea TaxID=543527 RepID=UPI001476DAED|nr:FHA domain-containing protein [Saccharothrix variisporea]